MSNSTKIFIVAAGLAGIAVVALCTRAQKTNTPRAAAVIPDQEALEQSMPMDLIPTLSHTMPQELAEIAALYPRFVDEISRAKLGVDAVVADEIELSLLRVRNAILTELAATAQTQTKGPSERWVMVAISPGVAARLEEQFHAQLTAFEFRYRIRITPEMRETWAVALGHFGRDHVGFIVRSDDDGKADAPIDQARYVSIESLMTRTDHKGFVGSITSSYDKEGFQKLYGPIADLALFGVN